MEKIHKQLARRALDNVMVSWDEVEKTFPKSQITSINLTFHNTVDHGVVVNARATTKLIIFSTVEEYPIV